MSEANARWQELREAHLKRRAPVELAAHEAEWMLATTGEKKWEEESARLGGELQRLLANRETYAALLDLRDSGEIVNPVAKRELDVLILAHSGRQTSPELLEELVALEMKAETLYANFRPRLDGKPVTENDVRKTLGESDDVELRRRTWEASKEIGPQAAPLVLEMVEKRNRAARDQGHRDYYAMALALQEIDEGFLFETLDDLERLTAEPYDDLIGNLFSRLASRFGISTADVRPWHLSDPFFQEAVPPEDLELGRFYEGADLEELTREFCARIGFDVSDILRRSDLRPREGKNQHAFCTHVDRTTDDIRVLCNIQNDEYWMDTMLHEFGHAVYDQQLAPDLPWLLRQPAHMLSTEAIALLFGRLATDPDWMVRYLGVGPEEVIPIRESLRELQRTKQLLFPRWVMVMCHFERALYADPTADLDTLWWDLVERFQKVTRPEGRKSPDWACKIHVALAPVYYHNYLLGDLMASQLHSWLLREAGEPYFDVPETGRLLTERLFTQGARRPWNEALGHATGQPLDPGHYVEQFITVPS